MILALVLVAKVAETALIAAVVLHGSKKMASAIEQVGQALAGAHSAAYDQLKADIEAHVALVAAKDAEIADLTAKLAAATAGTSDADLTALDSLLKPTAGATETPVTTPDNPPAAPTPSTAS